MIYYTKFQQIDASFSGNYSGKYVEVKQDGVLITPKEQIVGEFLMK